MFRPVVRRLASGARELGDALLLHGAKGVVVQVKSRNGDPSDVRREERWIMKAAEKAARQAAGTVRSLRSAPATLENLRGRPIEIDGSHYEWVGVVVIDHPSPPTGLVLNPPASDLSVLVLARRDWEFLFDQLRSTYAVIQYIHRVSGEGSAGLGREAVRYYQFAQADEDAPVEPVDPAYLGATGLQVSAPLLPKEPVGADDTEAHLLLRMVMEDIATAPISVEIGEAMRLHVLADLDRLPVAHRSEMGRIVRSMLDDVTSVEHGAIMWRFRRLCIPGEPQIAFGACTRFSDLVCEAFRQWVLLRHHQFGQVMGAVDELASVGVLLTPRRGSTRRWDTTMVRVQGDPELTADELAGLEELWDTDAA